MHIFISPNASFPMKVIFFCSTAGPWRVHWVKPKSSNLHAFRCLGTSPAADILAVIQARGRKYK